MDGGGACVELRAGGDTCAADPASYADANRHPKPNSRAHHNAYGSTGLTTGANADPDLDAHPNPNPHLNPDTDAVAHGGVHPGAAGGGLGAIGWDV